MLCLLKSRKNIACKKLNITSPPSYGLSFNPMHYCTVGTTNQKEASYDRNNFDRGSYLNRCEDKKDLLQKETKASVFVPPSLRDGFLRGVIMF